MLKRTMGRLLLALLVVTGLAGTVKDTTLTKQERKFAANYLKETKSDLLNSVKGLSDAQLNFKPSPDRWSIRECVYHIALSEKNLWNMVGAAMKEPATPEKRSEIKVSDDNLIKMVLDRTHKATAAEAITPDKGNWTSTDEALNEFKTERAEHVKYVKTTTEDLRNHLSQGPAGWLDEYQFILLMAAHSSRHTAQINEVKMDPNFPKN